MAAFIKESLAVKYLQYIVASPLPPATHTVHLCSKAVEVISASRAARGEIKSLVVSVQGRKTEAHEKITSAITRHIQEARAEKVCVCVCVYVCVCVCTCVFGGDRCGYECMKCTCLLACVWR